jgi:cellulose synthase/poly-beta-1,6-N-acetylglucosamine synthase-like glycosyltransferase
MTTAQVAILVIYACIVAAWPVRLLVLHIILRRQVALTNQSPHYDGQSPPLVSAILPAKDEEAYLAVCLRSICNLTYSNLEILVVDDRSTDRTGEIARKIASTDQRVRVITIDELPTGWTGKTHALDHAAHLARGQWLLFADADTIHAPDSLGIMMEYARSQQAVLVSLLPELRCESFWELLMQPIAAITLMQSFPLHKLNNDRSNLAFANGQYILIERTAYDAAGGHQAVRDRFVEDIALAQRVKALGLPIRVALARGIVSCRMYASFAQLIRGWSRIFYDAFGRNPWRLTIKLFDPIIFCQTGHVALAVGLMLSARDGGTFAIWLVALSIAHHVLMYLVFRRVYRASIDLGAFSLWYPVANLVVDVILIRAIGMCLTGKVTWRGTNYAPVAPAIESTPAAND